MEIQKTFDGHKHIGKFFQAFQENPIQQGLRSSIYLIIDKMRYFSGPPEIIQSAGDISVLLLKMDWAIQKGHEEEVCELRQKIVDYGQNWNEKEVPQTKLSKRKYNNSKNPNCCRG